MKSNRSKVSELLVWFQNLPKEVSPCYITIYNFEEFVKTYSLMLYANRIDVQYKGDGLIFDGLWRMITQKPSTITAHRVHDLLDKIEEVDPDFKWTLRGLTSHIFRDEYTLIEEKYMKYKVDFPDLQERIEEAERINQEDTHEVAKLRAKAYGEPVEDEPKESAKEKASKLWKVDTEEE